MRRNAIRTSIVLLAVLLLPLLVLVAQETRVLLIEGQQGEASVGAVRITSTTHGGLLQAISHGGDRVDERNP